MSFEDATSALNGAMAEEFGTSAPASPTPTPVEQAPVVPTTPEGQTAPVQPSQVRDEFGRFAPNTPAPAGDTTPNLFEGTAVNPDTLPPELQPLAKQLQAAFTQKTQALAQQRTQIESLGSFDELTQAAELFRNLQDPGYLQEFHSELSKALESQGLTPGQARAEAARQIEGSTAPTAPVSDALARLKDDPELAPLVDHFSQLESNSRSLEARLNSFEQAQQQRAEAEQLAQAQMALAGEIQRQEMAIRQANPHYTDSDMDAVYELSAFHDGSLLEAQQRYEQIVQNRVERYLASKQAVTPASGPVHGTGTSEVPVPVSDLQEAYRAALGHLAEQGIDSLA
jgi:hypothetical protein